MAKKFDQGVMWYTTARVDIYFPEDAICCRYCPLFGTEYGTRRDYCKRTGEPIPDPDNMIGGFCQLVFEKKEENNAEPEEA